MPLFAMISGMFVKTEIYRYDLAQRSHAFFLPSLPPLNILVVVAVVDVAVWSWVPPFIVSHFYLSRSSRSSLKELAVFVCW